MSWNQDLRRTIGKARRLRRRAKLSARDREVLDQVIAELETTSVQLESVASGQRRGLVLDVVSRLAWLVLLRGCDGSSS